MPTFADEHPEAGAFVFDAYGTLLDVHAAVARVPLGPDARLFSELWRAKQLEYSWVNAMIGTYADFRTLTERALDHALARFPSVHPAARGALLAAYLELDAYPEAAGVLARLKASGRRTAVLSNGEPGMLASAFAASGLAGSLDAVISAHEARTFKTMPRVYALVERHLGVAPSRVAFVSSNRWDVAGATAYGFTCAWVNRGGLPDEYPEFPPAATLASLDGVV